MFRCNEVEMASAWLTPYTLCLAKLFDIMTSVIKDLLDTEWGN